MPNCPRALERANAVRWCVTIALVVLVVVVTAALPRTRRAPRTKPGALETVVLASTAKRGKNGLSLAGQTPFVENERGLGLVLDLKSSSPLSALSLQIVLYSRLTSRTEFLGTLGAPPFPAPVTPIDTLAPIDLAAVAPRDRTPVPGGARVRLQLPVTTATSIVPVAADGVDEALELPGCGGPACDGVYPLTITLTEVGGDVTLGSLTTHLVYVASPAGSRRLEVALVTPVGASGAVSTSVRLSHAGLQRTDGLLDALRRSPELPSDLAVFPSWLVELEADHTPAARRTLELLRRVLSPPSNLGVAELPFAPVELSSLERAGLAGQIVLQLERGRTALQSLLPDATTASALVDFSDPGNAAVTVLARHGVDDLVVPATSLTPIDNVTTDSAPFRLEGAEASLTAASAEGLEADQALSSELSTGTDPVLDANRALADLAQIFFEVPFATEPRVIAIVLPERDTVNPVALETFLDGIEASPVLAAVSLSQAFASVAPGGGCAPGTFGCSPAARSLQTPHPGPGATLTRHALARSEVDLAALRSVEPSARASLTELGDAILDAEAASISESTRQGMLAQLPSALAMLRSSLSIASTEPVTLTTAKSRLPVTVVSRSPTPVDVLVRLSSPELSFPQGSSFQLHLDGHAVTRSVSVVARVTGDFTLTIAVSTPSEHLALLHTQLSVRSTAISGVALGLSLGALALLSLWWVRSWRHRRVVASR